MRGRKRIMGWGDRRKEGYDLKGRVEVWRFGILYGGFLGS